MYQRLRVPMVVVAVAMLLIVQSHAGQAAGQTTLRLWPGRAPGVGATVANEVDQTKPSDPLIAGSPIIKLGGVSVPTLTFYRAEGKNTGAAVVVFPGGGYKILAMDLEGTEVCKWLTGAGINCVLLKYRVPDSGPYPKSAAALQDAQRALGVVRLHAEEWKIDPRRVGVLGFSAGGHLAAALSTHYEKRVYEPEDAADQQSCRPDFEVLIYPAYLAMPVKEGEQDFVPNPEIRVTAQTPPAFLLQAEDDPVRVENTTVFYGELKKAGVPAEMHVYAKGGHGYGLRRTDDPVTEWPELVEKWFKTIGVLAARADAPSAH